MNGINVHPYVRRCLALVAITSMALAINASAQYTVSVTRNGPQNFYKNSCPFNQTSFTITAYPGPYQDVEVYFYVGGDGTDFSPDPNPCDAIERRDFTVSCPNGELEKTPGVPNTYSVVIPALQGSVTINITALNSTTPGQCGFQTVLMTIPDGVDYTGGVYIVNPNAAQAVAYLYPPITVSVAPSSFPPYLSKTYQNTISFTLTANEAPPQNMLITFLVGGNGTPFNTGDPCLAYYPTDFTVSGCNQAPFPDGFYVYLPAGQTSISFNVTAAGSGCDCDSGYQTLLVTVPTPPSCSGYNPNTSSAQATGYIYP